MTHIGQFKTLNLMVLFAKIIKIVLIMYYTRDVQDITNTFLCHIFVLQQLFYQFLNKTEEIKFFKNNFFFFKIWIFFQLLPF